MNNPKISVIVPVYNAEKWLRRCVDSILAQTYTDFELLLIDDGSKDGSGAICDEYAATDPRVRTFHKPNGGVSSARNLGLDNASGEYITFVDADDWIESEYLAALIGYENADFRMSLFWVDYPDGMSSISCGKMPIDSILSVQETVDICNSMLWNVWCKLYKRDIIKQLGLRFIVGFDLGEDTFFNYTYLSGADNAILFGKASYHYRQDNPESLSKKKPSAATLRRFLELTEETFDRLKSKIDVGLPRNVLISFFIRQLISTRADGEMFRRALDNDMVKSFLTGPHIGVKRKLISKLLRHRMRHLTLFLTNNIGNPF